MKNMRLSLLMGAPRGYRTAVKQSATSSIILLSIICMNGVLRSTSTISFFFITSTAYLPYEEKTAPIGEGGSVANVEPKNNAKAKDRLPTNED